MKQWYALYVSLYYYLGYFDQNIDAILVVFVFGGDIQNVLNHIA